MEPAVHLARDSVIYFPCLSLRNCRSGGIGRRTRLKIWRDLISWGFKSPLRHQDSRRLHRSMSPAHYQSRADGISGRSRYRSRSTNVEVRAVSALLTGKQQRVERCSPERLPAARASDREHHVSFSPQSFKVKCPIRNMFYNMSIIHDLILMILMI